MDIKLLQKSLIFRNMNDDEIHSALSALQAVEKKYKKDDVVMSAGIITDTMGLVISGSVTVESNEIWGNRTILSHIGAGGFFAETYALLDDEVMLVDVRENEN